ncbi:MAG: hypothetical protein AAF203_02110 [Pseudomonadota bacterium]
MKKVSLVIPFALMFFVFGCSEDDNTDTPVSESVTYTVSSTATDSTTSTNSSVTCDGTPLSLTGLTASVLIQTSGTSYVLGGSTISPLAACIGSYLLTGVSFGDDGNFTFSLPGAAFACTDVSGSSVASCDVNSIACDTSSTDPATVFAGTYTQTSTVLVLTYTAPSSGSFCASGQTEVVTMVVDDSN